MVNQVMVATVKLSKWWLQLDQEEPLYNLTHFPGPLGCQIRQVLHRCQPLYICVINDHEYVPLVVNTSRSFPHSWPITGFVTRLTRWVPPVEQELLTLLEHLSSPPLFSEVRVTRSNIMLQVEAKSGPSVLDSSDIVQKVIPVDVRLIFCFKYSSFPYIIWCNSVLDRTDFQIYARICQSSCYL
jgi:hypothetical protein